MITLDGKEVKVGDKLWSFSYGWGNAIYVNLNCFQVEFNKKFCTYISGIAITETARTLFWDEIKFDIPKPPKSKVKKWKWLMKCPSIQPDYFVTGSFYSDHQSAEYACPGETALFAISDSEIEVDE